jgi:hypothetical protein
MDAIGIWPSIHLLEYAYRVVYSSFHKLWIAAGNDLTDPLKRIVTSQDGITWQGRVNSVTSLGPRFGIAE